MAYLNISKWPGTAHVSVTEDDDNLGSTLPDFNWMLVRHIVHSSSGKAKNALALVVLSKVGVVSCVTSEGKPYVSVGEVLKRRPLISRHDCHVYPVLHSIR